MTENAKNELKDFLKSILEILFGALIAFVFFTQILYPCVVNGNSMESTLHDDDVGLSFYITKKIKINRFDIVVIDVSNEEEKLIVKRVIGLPGDTVEYKDNKLYINGEYYEEDFTNVGAITEDLTVTCGEDEYFCLGDNRNISKDSRYYGCFKYKNIKSTHFVRLYPFNSIGVY